MDYSSLFSSGLRAISSRHRRTSSTVEKSPTSPHFPPQPWSQRHERTLSLIISPKKRRSLSQRGGTHGEEVQPVAKSTAGRSWDSPTLPTFSTSYLNLHEEPDSELISPSENFATGSFAPSSPAITTAHSPIKGQSTAQYQRKRKISVSESFLSFTPSPAENLVFTYPKSHSTPSSNPRHMSSRPPSRRHSIAQSVRVDLKAWTAGPLPPIPSSPEREQAGYEEGTDMAVGADESEEDWRSVIDQLLENDSSLPL